MAFSAQLFVRDTRCFLGFSALPIRSRIFPSVVLFCFIKLGKIPERALLCTVDVVGLYPSNPQGEGLEAIREALDRRDNSGVATDTLVGLASLVLENNYFE